MVDHFFEWIITLKEKAFGTITSCSFWELSFVLPLARQLPLQAEGPVTFKRIGKTSQLASLPDNAGEVSSESESDNTNPKGKRGASKENTVAKEIQCRCLFLVVSEAMPFPSTIYIKSVCFSNLNLQPRSTKTSTNLVHRYLPDLPSWVIWSKGWKERLKVNPNPALNENDWTGQSLTKGMSRTFVSTSTSTNSPLGPQKKNKLPSTHLGPGTSKLSRMPWTSCTVSTRQWNRRRWTPVISWTRIVMIPTKSSGGLK